MLSQQPAWRWTPDSDFTKTDSLRKHPTIQEQWAGKLQ